MADYRVVSTGNPGDREMVGWRAYEYIEDGRGGLIDTPAVDGGMRQQAPGWRRAPARRAQIAALNREMQECAGRLRAEGHDVTIYPFNLDIVT